MDWILAKIIHAILNERLLVVKAHKCSEKTNLCSCRLPVIPQPQLGSPSAEGRGQCVRAAVGNSLQVAYFYQALSLKLN